MSEDYTTSYEGVGTISWTVPAMCYRLKLVQGWGSGGGPARQAGGGGAWAQKSDIVVTPGETLTFVAANTRSGSYLSSPAPHTEIRRGSTVLFRSASGGHGTAKTPGLGGSASNCIADLAYSGGNGGAGAPEGSYPYHYGGGGGAASPSGPGGDGRPGVSGVGGGAGGDSSSGALGAIAWPYRGAQSHALGGGGTYGGSDFSNGDDYTGLAGTPGGGSGGGAYGSSMYGTSWAGHGKLTVTHTIFDTAPEEPAPARKAPRSSFIQ